MLVTSKMQKTQAKLKGDVTVCDLAEQSWAVKAELGMQCWD